MLEVTLMCAHFPHGSAIAPLVDVMLPIGAQAYNIVMVTAEISKHNSSLVRKLKIVYL